MTVTLPPDLAELLGKTGHRWPDADEDQLIAMADGWQALGHRVETLRAENARTTEAILAANTGRGLEAFKKWVRKFDALMLRLVEVCARAEAVLVAIARAVLNAKKAILTALAVLAKAIALAKHAARYIPRYGEAISEIIDKIVEPYFTEARRVITEIVTRVADLISETIVPAIVVLIRFVKDIVQELRKLIKGRTGEDWPTNPSQTPHPDRKPTGHPAKWKSTDDHATRRGRRLENEAAITLAQAGFDVRQMGGKNVDYEIEGKRFDCAAPTSDNPHSIWKNLLTKKIQKGQTDRLIININDPEARVTVDQLRRQFQEHPMPGLREAKVIGPGGAIIDIYP